MDRHADSPARPESESDGQSELSNQILDYHKKSVFDHKEFVPEGCVDKIVRNRKVVLNAMKRGIESKDDEELADFILEKAKKVFAITINIGFEDSKLYRVMQAFKKQNFHDDNGLPIKPVDDQNHILSSICRRLWNRSKIHFFHRQQWEFMAPIFSTSQSNQDFNPDSILPIIYKEASREGAFSNVYKVSVHPSHYKDPEQRVRTLFMIQYSIVY